MELTTLLTWAASVFMAGFLVMALRGSGTGAGQTQRQSAREVLLNIILGYGISFTANAVILPLYGYNVSMEQNLQMGLFFTVISVIRGFLIRRLFNYLMVRDQRKT